MASNYPALKLSYFDFSGGRGEPARIALHYANIPFEDNRIPTSEWPERKADFIFHQLPELEIDGQVLTQSNAINRYVGKLAGLYPEDLIQAALCDAVMDNVDDAVQPVVNTFFMPEPEKRMIREDLVANLLPRFLSGLNQQLIENGGLYFVEKRLTMADLKAYIWIKSLLNGHLDHIPTTIVGDHAPELLSHARHINSLLDHHQLNLKSTA